MPQAPAARQERERLTLSAFRHDPVLAKIIKVVVVLDPGRPIAPERPFDAGACGPADPGPLSSEIKRERPGAEITEEAAKARAGLLADEAVLVAAQATPTFA